MAGRPRLAWSPIGLDGHQQAAVGGLLLEIKSPHAGIFGAGVCRVEHALDGRCAAAPLGWWEQAEDAEAAMVAAEGVAGTMLRERVKADVAALAQLGASIDDEARFALAKRVLEVVRVHEEDAQDPPPVDFERGQSMGMRAVCFALRGVLGITKISPLPKEPPR